MKQNSAETLGKLKIAMPNRRQRPDQKEEHNSNRELGEALHSPKSVQSPNTGRRRMVATMMSVGNTNNAALGASPSLETTFGF